MQSSSGPTISPTAGHGYMNNRKNRLYSNPFFDMASEQMPKDIKSFFKHCELVYVNSPIIMNGIAKLVTYPIRDFKYKTTSKKKREKTKEYIEGKLDLKSHLIQVATERYIYGNVYRSMYFPFHRFLKCESCKQQTNIKEADFKVKKDKFILNCRCGYRGNSEVEDKDTQDLSRLRIVNWDPHAITLQSNPITGQVRYYYDIPSSIKLGATRGDRVIVEDLPKVFFDASVKNKKVEFGDNFYHLKCTSLSGYSTGYGLSPLISVLKLFHYKATLRKSAEAIAHEHITPKNILYPQGTTSDPSVSSNLRKWKEEITKGVERWRYDPGAMMTAPYPTGVSNVGSQGRGLLPTNEIKEARNEMLLSLSIPPDLVYNPSGIQKSTVALAMMENQLKPLKSELEEYANWIIDMLNAKYDLDLCDVELQEFSLTDDNQNKQFLMQGAQKGGVSSTTVMESMGLDPHEERENQKKEQIQQYEMQKDLEHRMREIDQNVSQQTSDEQAAMEDGTIPQYNQQKLLAKASQMAQQLIQVPYEQRRSYMSQLQNEDAVMHALVSQQLSNLHDQGHGPGGDQ